MHPPSVACNLIGNRTLTDPHMPITARLSKQFYDRLGEPIATELVDWFNDVDATYRADLRELNESNFARSDARSGQRMAELNAMFERRLAEFEVKFERELARLRTELRIEIASSKTEMMRWMFAPWLTQIATFFALWMRGA